MESENSIRESYRYFKESIYYWIVFNRIAYKDKRQKKTVVFYPNLPGGRHVFGRIFNILRFHITNDLSLVNQASFIVNWEDTTYRKEVPELLKPAGDRNIINIRCKDISKKHVDEVFGKIFGYQTMLDPTTYKGKCVKKSDINALHNGTIIECPIAKPEAGFIYQKLINNQEGEFIEDIRVPVFRNAIPFVYLKNRPVQTRFASKNTKCVITPTEKIFTKDEVDKIIKFCNLIGLDQGELDVLRDRNEGRIYIVDVNNTPGGPPNGLSPINRYRALYKITNAFVENFINQPFTTSSKKVFQK